jgi:hypothetical protein
MIVNLIEKMPIMGDPPGLYTHSGNIYVVTTENTSPLALWLGQALANALRDVSAQKPGLSEEFVLRALTIARGKVMASDVSMP